jgi:hypothetical protein
MNLPASTPSRVFVLGLPGTQIVYRSDTHEITTEMTEMCVVTSTVIEEKAAAKSRAASEKKGT